MKNWITDNPQYGYAVSDIEELSADEVGRKRLVSDWDANVANPDVVKQQAEKALKDKKQLAIKTKLGLTDQDLKDLKDVLVGR